MDDEPGAEPTTAEQAELIRAVEQLARDWAGMQNPSATGEPDGELRLLAVLKKIDEACQAAAARAAVAALKQGAGFEDLGEAWGFSWQAASKRWGHLARGERVAVVISRRNRVHRDGYGEVDGDGQYDMDRGAWPVGEEVRRKARYAVIAVDGTVRRVYKITDGWEPDQHSPKWHFTGTLLDDPEIEAAHAAGDLPLKPGDSCPTQRGRAYRPHWF
ncbi:hypothetical protein ACFVXG_38160 [Kitasatospora sp. NPDC058162]|uniref:hypothetical protein n=1 Tax=Kitasatospora sp. NPDC058162 TaxID=3346362 RepID=UPI0036D9B739